MPWAAGAAAVLVAIGAMVFATAGGGQAGPGGTPPPAAGDEVLFVVTGTRNEQQPTLPDAARTLLMERSDSSGDGTPSAVVMGVDGDGSTTRGYVDLVVRRGKGPNAERETSRQRRRDGAEKKVDQVQGLVSGVQATLPGHALLAGLQEAGRSTAGTVVVCSSGIDTVAPVDLRALGFDYSPATLVKYLRDHDALPHLDGKTVLLALTPVDGAQKRLGEPVRRQLEELWSTVISEAGGKVRAVQAGASRHQDGAVPTPAVEVPRLPPPPEPPAEGETVRQVLPGSVLFVPDEAELLDRAQARRVILDLATVIGAGSRVTVVGHTAYTDGSGDRGLSLSRKRAAVIRDLLVEAGVAPGAIKKVDGVGDRKPIRLPRDHKDNRAVVVTVTNPPTSR